MRFPTDSEAKLHSHSVSAAAVAPDSLRGKQINEAWTLQFGSATFASTFPYRCVTTASD